VQIPDGILWLAAGFRSDGRNRVSVPAPDQRHFSNRELLHGTQAAGKLRMFFFCLCLSRLTHVGRVAATSLKSSLSLMTTNFK